MSADTAGPGPTAPARGRRAAAAAVAAAPGQGMTAVRERTAAARGLLDRPLTSYYLVLGITGLLLALGLVMVFSSTTAYDLLYGLPLYSGFEHQLLGAIVGAGLMWGMSKCAPRLFRVAARPLLLASIIGLVAVLAVGQTVAGGTRWIGVAGFQLQPSEFAKLAFVLWGADLLARRDELGQLTDWRPLLIPLMPAMAVICLLVMLGHDLGTTFLLAIIFLALLWVIGIPARLFLALLGLMAFAMLAFVVVEPYAMTRLTSFLAPQNKITGADWQAVEGKWAIGSGGLFGVGLGAGGGKWGWVPESTTDFIFAILGEELGLIGTLCVSVLYAGLAYAGLRIARRVTDTFMRLAAAAITAWIVGQAMVNIGAVLGVLPITGVPLPLISYGLSSLLATMVALGMLLAFARREPGAAQALAAAGPSLPRRALSWLGPGGQRR
ncbi:MAG: putative lipid II flippase FtsW [Streptosporangiaceae bacterium]